MKKLFFIYTIPQFYDRLYRPVMAEAFDADENVEVRFTMDNSVLLDTLSNNVVPTALTKRRLLRLMENCQDAGADCIVVGCTAINTATKELAAMIDVPVLSVDEPMIQKVLKDGRKKVAVLSHTQINAMTIQRRLQAEDPSIEVDLYPVEGAADDMNEGRQESFSARMRAGALAIPADYDAIVLGHISAENVDLSGIDTPVYRTGEACVEAIRAALK